MHRQKVVSCPRFVHFFGPDGAGKSTQVDLLVSKLKSNGTNVKKCWIRSPHTLAFLLSMFFLRIGFYRVSSTSIGRCDMFPATNYEPKHGNVPPWDIRVNPWRGTILNREGNVVVLERIPLVNRSVLLRWFWAAIELVSVLPLIIYRVYFQLFLGYILVAERYVIDTIVTIAYFIDDFGFLYSPLATALLYCIPKDSAFIYLDSSYETMIKRRGINVEVRCFIEFQRKAYSILANHLEALMIDTSRLSVEETSAIISRYVGLG